MSDEIMCIFIDYVCSSSVESFTDYNKYICVDKS